MRRLKIFSLLSGISLCSCSAAEVSQFSLSEECQSFAIPAIYGRSIHAAEVAVITIDHALKRTQIGDVLLPYDNCDTGGFLCMDGAIPIIVKTTPGPGTVSIGDQEIGVESSWVRDDIPKPPLITTRYALPEWSFETVYDFRLGLIAIKTGDDTYFRTSEPLEYCNK